MGHEWIEQETCPQSPRITIQDKYLDLPKRTTVINGDDITNLKILLGCSETVEQFIASI